MRATMHPAFSHHALDGRGRSPLVKAAPEATPNGNAHAPGQIPIPASCPTLLNRSPGVLLHGVKVNRHHGQHSRIHRYNSFYMNTLNNNPRTLRDLPRMGV
jgi:hypothetical protein